MSEMTPKRLRSAASETAEAWGEDDPNVVDMRAAASAWEADIARLKETASALQRMSQRWADGQVRIEALGAVQQTGEMLWPHVCNWMPQKGRGRQAAERFYDALMAAAKEKP